jgi:hypothetical protein
MEDEALVVAGAEWPAGVGSPALARPERLERLEAMGVQIVGKR